MNAFKKATKRITAVAASAAMVSSAVFGAGLSDYPSNFVSGGSFNADVVVGAAADAMDSTSANSIISNLESRYSSSGGMVEISYRATGSGKSVEVSSSNDDLNYGQDLDAAESEFDDGDFPSFLADGTVVDNDYEDEEYDYEQLIELGDAAVVFGRSYDMDDETDVPEVFLDLGASTYTYVLHVDFKDTLLIATDAGDDDDEGLVNSETITMFGTTLTFDPANDVTDDLVMFASSNIVTAVQGQKVSVESDGQTYEVEVLGANSDDSEVTLEVNGISKSVSEGTNTKVGGLDVYVDEVFISNVGGDSAAVRLFLGSDEITFPVTAFDGWTEVEVDGDSLNGYEVRANLGNGGNWSALDDLEFRLTAQDLDDEVEYLRVGDSVVDPLFGTLAVEFNGASDDFEDGDMWMIERSSDDAKLTFTNRDGDEYSFEVYTGDGTSVVAHEDLWINGSRTNYTSLAEDSVFILNEDTGATDFVSKVYQVSRVYTEDGDDKVELEDLTDGSKTSYEDGDEVDDTGAYVRTINTTSDTFDLWDVASGGNSSDAVSVINTLYTKNDVRIVLDTANDDFDVTENMDDNIDETGDVSAASFTVDVTTDADDDIILGVSGASNLVSADDEDSDYEYGLSEMGSYYILETDQSGEDFVMYTPIEELDYMVNFVTGDVGQTNTKLVAAADADAEEQALVDAGFEIVDVREMASEDVDFAISAPMMDSDVSSSDDLIVVGGPAVNMVAADLLGLSYPAVGAASGLSAGEAMVKYFATENSVLVYGWSKEDTAAAASALNAGGLSGSEYSVN